MGDPVVVEQSLRRRTDAGRELDRIIGAGLITPLYQPIVSLQSLRAVAFEALARGPHGSALEMPAALFGAASRHDRLSELDWACRSAAVQGAFDAEYLPPAALFVNVEPAAAGESVPRQYEQLMARAQSGLRIVFEFTERALTDHPGDVLRAVRVLRDLGAMIALDDVGVDPRSLALLPFLEPEVVKLDMSLVHEPHRSATFATHQAVQAYAEDTGAIVLAEGIENQEHVDAALALGATHGQGWLFGHPSPLPHAHEWEPVELFDARVRTVADSHHTPFEWLAQQGAPASRATAGHLQGLADHLLGVAAGLGDAAVVIIAGSRDVHVPLQRRLTELAEVAAFVGVISDAPPALHRGLRTGLTGPAESLAAERALCILAPTYAVAVAASTPDDAGRCEVRTTHDRDNVAAVARRLMARVAPACEPPQTVSASLSASASPPA
ncbi:MAG: EAL domain-containing protein [Patulibacter minatonensis]